MTPLFKAWFRLTVGAIVVLGSVVAAYMVAGWAALFLCLLAALNGLLMSLNGCLDVLEARKVIQAPQR